MVEQRASLTALPSPKPGSLRCFILHASSCKLSFRINFEIGSFCLSFADLGNYLTDKHNLLLRDSLSSNSSLPVTPAHHRIINMKGTVQATSSEPREFH